MSGNTGEAVRIAAELGWLETVGVKIKPNYERAEFEEKLVRMQVEVPWDRLR